MHVMKLLRDFGLAVDIEVVVPLHPKMLTTIRPRVPHFWPVLPEVGILRQDSPSKSYFHSTNGARCVSNQRLGYEQMHAPASQRIRPECSNKCEIDIDLLLRNRSLLAELFNNGCRSSQLHVTKCNAQV
jgi:hypothetical protein